MNEKKQSPRPRPFGFQHTWLPCLLLGFGLLFAGGIAHAQDDFQVAAEVPEATTIDLATFRLPNGNEVRFIGVPELDELLIGEIVDAGPSENFVIDPEMDPVALFHALAPEDSPVPEMIARLDTGNLLAGRRQVRALEGTVEAPLQAFATEAPVTRAGSGSCASGTAGAQYFEDNHCDTLGGPGYGSSEKYCYSGAYDWIQKTSSSKRRATYTRMASCGSGMNHLRHFYSTASGYTTQVNVYVDPNKVISWWSYTDGIKRYRRVRFEEHDSAGWVRGWVVYHSEVAGGW